MKRSDILEIVTKAMDGKVTKNTVHEILHLFEEVGMLPPKNGWTGDMYLEGHQWEEE